MRGEVFLRRLCAYLRVWDSHDRVIRVAPVRVNDGLRCAEKWGRDRSRVRMAIHRFGLGEWDDAGWC